MGGVPSVLLLLWCRGGCSTATVAAALTFFPPSPPCYTCLGYSQHALIELPLGGLLALCQWILGSERHLSAYSWPDEIWTSPMAHDSSSDNGIRGKRDGGVETPHLRKKDDSGELELVLDEALESTVSTADVRVVTIRTDRPGTGWVKKKSGVGTNPMPPSGETVSKSGTMSSTTSTTSTGATATGESGNTSSSGSRRKKGNVIPLALYRKANARYTVVYSHGNATDIGAMHDRCAGIAKEVGVNVLAYDYTGYGAATGSPTEAQTYRDIEAVCAWARRHILREGEDGSGRNKGHGLILYGQSVGSGPTCYLAAERAKGDFAGVVLHSPILSGMRVLTESRALSCLDIYPNVDRIARVRCPVMVVHGLKDEEVPWEHGKGIFEAVPEKYRRRPWWVPDRGHNDICEGRRHLRLVFQKHGYSCRSGWILLCFEASCMWRRRRRGLMAKPYHLAESESAEFYQRMRAFVQSLDDEAVVPGVIPANQRNAQESDRKPKQRSSSSTLVANRSVVEPPSLGVAAVQSSPSSPVTDSTTNDSIDCLKSADAGVNVSAESARDCST